MLRTSRSSQENRAPVSCFLALHARCIGGFGFSSRPELIADRIIRRNLVDSGWIISAKTSVQSVLDKHRQHLFTDEFNLYSRGHFDFAVYSEEEHEPAFAVEFDGLGHHDGAQAARDVIKNRLCAQAELPVLRIGGNELREAEEVSVLDWLLERFVTWEAETPDAAEALLDDVASTGGEGAAAELAESPEDLVSILAATFTGEFPFPANAEIARRLMKAPYQNFLEYLAPLEFEERHGGCPLARHKCRVQPLSGGCRGKSDRGLT